MKNKLTFFISHNLSQSIFFFLVLFLEFFYFIFIAFKKLNKLDLIFDYSKLLCSLGLFFNNIRFLTKSYHHKLLLQIKALLLQVHIFLQQEIILLIYLFTKPILFLQHYFSLKFFFSKFEFFLILEQIFSL